MTKTKTNEDISSSISLEGSTRLDSETTTPIDFIEKETPSSKKIDDSL